MDYFIEYYGFKKDPFETNHDISSFYMSSVHKPVLARLYKSVYEDGIDIIFGSEGTGKTITVKKFLSELKQTPYVYISYAGETIEQIVDILLDTVYSEPFEGSIREKVSKIQEIAKNKRIVIVIDNINEASLNLIENLRILLEAKNIKLILVGNEFLEKIVRLSSMKQLSTRIRNSLFLKNLNKKDTKKYINTKLFGSGGNVSIPRKSYKLIYEITKGNPYNINLLMEEALYLSSLKKKKKIKPKIIKKAAKNLGFKVKRKIGLFGTLIFLLLLIIAGLFVYYSGLLTFEQEQIYQKQQQQNIQEEESKPTEEQKQIKTQTSVATVEQQQKELEKKEIEAVINVSLLNIRENPDTNSRILAVVPKGYKVKILEEGENGWVKVLYYSRSQKREIIGWVNKKYLLIQENNNG